MYGTLMVARFDKKHRVKVDTKRHVSIPQWKGWLFWHRYTLYSPEEFFGCLTIYSRSNRPVEYSTLAEATDFLKRAVVQESHNAKLGVYYEPSEI